jgi:hypothetical protein
LRELSGLDSLEETLYNMWLFNREEFVDLRIPTLQPVKSMEHDESMQRLRRIFTDTIYQYWADFPTHLRPRMRDCCSVSSPVRFADRGESLQDVQQFLFIIPLNEIALEFEMPTSYRMTPDLKYLVLRYVGDRYRFVDFSSGSSHSLAGFPRRESLA